MKAFTFPWGSPTVYMKSKRLIGYWPFTTLSMVGRTASEFASFFTAMARMPLS